MSGKSQAQLLNEYRREIRRSKSWRSDNYDTDWKRFIDLYRGKQVANASRQDRLIVNMIFSTINVLAPAVAVNNPKFVVNARRPDAAPQAVITEEVLNYIWRTYRYQEDFRLSLLDWLIVGHGWVKIGYKFTKPPAEKAISDAPTGDSGSTPPATTADAGDGDFGIDDRDDVPGNVESEMNVQVDRPFVERMSVFDMFVDPDARHPKEWAWVAQRIWRPVEDVKVDSRYSATARNKVSTKKWSRWSGSGDGDARNDSKNDKPLGFVEVIEYYDVKRQTVATFALSSEADADKDNGFLIKPQKMPYAMGQPFVMLRGYEVPDYFYTIGDVEQIESLQLELNETRSQMMNHRKRFQRKWLYEKDAFDRDGVAALESDIDNTMIPVMSDGNPANVIAPLPAVITPSDFYDQSNLISADLDRVSGVSDYQRAASQANVKRTATEAAMIQDSANSRSQDRLAKVETMLSQIGERLIGLLQQYMTGDQVARIVTMPGRAWVNYDADFIQGEFDYDVAAGSTEPVNETFRRQSALQLVDASMPFLQMGVANPVGLYMQVLQKGFGVKDVSGLVMQPSPPGGDPSQGGGDPNDPSQGQPQTLNAPTQDPNDAPGQLPPQSAPPPQGQPMPPGGPPGGGPPMPGGQGGPQPIPAGAVPPGMPQDMMSAGAQLPPGMLQQLMGDVQPPKNIKALSAAGQLPPELLRALMAAMPGAGR